LLEQVRSKHISIGGADVARVQRENEVDEELLEASTEKKRKDEDDVTSTPPTKRVTTHFSGVFHTSSRVYLYYGYAFADPSLNHVMNHRTRHIHLKWKNYLR
jgi:hypothetical protein